jgi:hypothetical protein
MRMKTRRRLDAALKATNPARFSRISNSVKPARGSVVERR